VITIVDFDDSFTYNIYSDLCKSHDVCVINYKEFIQQVNNGDYDSRHVFILGPGPGHPDDYLEIIEPISALLLEESIMVIGICLGHQLVWKSLGLPSSTAHNILHGQSEVISFKDFFYVKDVLIRVQRYNSLSVKMSKSLLDRYISQGWSIVQSQGEIYASRYNNTLTYQFHPESIGTTNKSILYSPINEFLLN
jgi:anthranilate/para-aminobenzoate synthase component II